MEGVYNQQQHIKVVFKKIKEGPLRNIYGKRGWCSLIFHIDLASMQDIVLM